MVGAGTAGLGVDDEQDQLGLGDGGLYLAPDVGDVGTGAFDAGRLCDTARVREIEATVALLNLTHETVACRTGDIFDDGAPFTEHAIEQGRLADVGPADQGYKGTFTHLL